jgi:LPPG:FO 2-phospho-L-lactate transferase
MSLMVHSRETGTVLALCGGIGGAKLALGLYHELPPGQLVVAVNTGDDFEHLGLHISPDLDTVLYTLGAIADSVRSWGRANETWNFMTALGELGGETWFQLGDHDLAMHIERTCWLRDGKPLSDFAAHAAQRLHIRADILPMCDDPVHTIVVTDEGELPFQRYFVERRCQPVVRGLRYEGAAQARLPAKLRETLANPALRAIVICPSNPYLSVDPLLAIAELRLALALVQVPVIAVSPLIGGKAVKGPTAKIMMELGIPVTTQSIAGHYRGLIHGLVIDTTDAHEAARLDIPVLVTQTLMRNLTDRNRLAGEVLAFADRIVSRNGTVRSSRLAIGMPS